MFYYHLVKWEIVYGFDWISNTIKSDVVKKSVVFFKKNENIFSEKNWSNILSKAVFFYVKLVLKTMSPRNGV